ncbi:hypothetical protein ANCDUO_24024 [Ancylostoma duodenale]|uniref:Tc1-like transposase DDE domain-containing protein n=1 Tax=Ancylostoma duodenale TaxID=51022 RepID=A0A0C2FM56_9BILA|nr:hypothetical protein ANCDUO_24024 [Ancylostoma duodenale]
MQWPACSPDLNPIENLWAIVARKVYANGAQYNTVNDLKVAVLSAWAYIPMDTINNLVSSMKNRIYEMWTSGWVNIVASDIRLNVSGRVVALDHRPQIVLGGCAAEVGSFHFEVGGGIVPWFVNIFRNITSSAFKNAVRDKGETIVA